MVDKINDYINYSINVKAQKFYYDHIASFCRMNGIRSMSDLYQFDQSGSPVDPKRSIPQKSRQSKTIYSKIPTPITPTPNSLVSETPRGKKCTAEEERNQ